MVRFPCGFWLPWSEPKPQPRAGIAGETGRRQRAALVTACARPLSPEDTVQVQAAQVGVSPHPPPALCSVEGAGGWRQAEGECAGGREAAGAGGGREEGGGSARGSAPSPLPLRRFH